MDAIFDDAKYVELYIKNTVFRSIYELNQEIEGKENDIANCKEMILMYAVSNVNEVVDPEWNNDKIRKIHMDVSEIFEQILESQKYLTYLYLIKSDYEYEQIRIQD